MRILMVCFVFPPRFSGAALQALKLAKELHKHDVICDFLVPNYLNRSIFYKEVLDGLVINRLIGSGYLFSISAIIFLLINKNNYKVIHIHGFWPSHFLFIYLAKLLGIRIVQKMTKGGENDSEINSNGIFGFLRIRSLRLISKYIAISSQLQSALIKNNIPANKIYTIPNGVEMTIPSPEESKYLVNIHKKYGIPKDSIILINVGVIDRRKNNIDIATIFFLLKNKYPNVYSQAILLFVGPFNDKKYFRILQKQIEKYKIKDRVIFTGQMDSQSLSILYTISHICVFAGSNEGLPNVLLEAKAASLPIVAYKTYGVEDVINDGQDGYLVAYSDSEKFCKRVANLISDPILRNRFSVNTYNDCKRRYDLSKIAKRYIHEIY